MKRPGPPERRGRLRAWPSCHRSFAETVPPRFSRIIAQVTVPRHCRSGFRCRVKSLQQITILMSDRCAPRPCRHSNGYGSHTYNFNREVAGRPLPSGRPRLPRWSDTTNGAGCAWGAAPSPDHLKKTASNHQSMVRRPFSSTTGAWAPEETMLPLQLTGDGLQRRQVNGRRDRVVWRHAATERFYQITLIWLAEREAV